MLQNTAVCPFKDRLSVYSCNLKTTCGCRRCHSWPMTAATARLPPPHWPASNGTLWLARSLLSCKGNKNETCAVCDVVSCFSFRQVLVTTLVPPFHWYRMGITASADKRLETMQTRPGNQTRVPSKISAYTWAYTTLESFRESCMEARVIPEGGRKRGHLRSGMTPWDEGEAASSAVP